MVEKYENKTAQIFLMPPRGPSDPLNIKTNQSYNYHKSCYASQIALTLMPIFANGDVPMCNVDYGCNHKIGNIFNSSIKEITLDLSSKLQLKEIQNFLEEKGETIVNINITDGSRISSFKLKNPRYIDRKSINILRNKEISLNIR